MSMYVKTIDVFQWSLTLSPSNAGEASCMYHLNHSPYETNDGSNHNFEELFKLDKKNTVCASVLGSCQIILCDIFGGKYSKHVWLLLSLDKFIIIWSLCQSSSNILSQCGYDFFELCYSICPAKALNILQICHCLVHSLLLVGEVCLTLFLNEPFNLL